jgi:hypothetical protein
MEQKGFFKENAISIMAAIVSLCALFVSFYQTNIMREQQYASVRPLVLVGNSMDTNVEDSTGRSEIFIWNKGIGPAIIKYVDFEYKGKHYSEFQLQDILHEITQLGDSSTYIPTRTSSATASAIAAGSELQMFKIHDKKHCFIFNNAYFAALQKDELNITVYFTDVYDRLFKTSLRSHKTEATTIREIEKVIPKEVRKYIDL